MNERKDETTETDDDERSTLERDQEQHGYYYDDETGYEVYDPANDEDEEDVEPDSDNPLT